MHVGLLRLAASLLREVKVMVDRTARDIAGDAIQDFVRGSISNREYERRFPTTKDDPALRAIYTSLWFCYSDVSEHTLTGKHALNNEGHAHVDRCILFLRTDLEFQWPLPKFRLKYGILRLLGLGRVVKRWEQDDMKMGEKQVWPFLNRAQYDCVISK